MSDFLTIPFSGADFTVRDAPDQPALFVFGVRKSGSSVMNAMVTALARMNAMHVVDIADKMFEIGVRVAVWQRDASMAALLRGGNLYGGFRNAPIAIAGHELVRDSAKILLVRDPRDALVSEYFSNAYSHSVPGEGEARDIFLRQRAEALRSGVCEYALAMAPALRSTLRDYTPFLSLPNLRLYRYEQAVMDKRWFLGEICEHFRWEASEEQIGQILSWADVRPSDEDPSRFIRKVTPGDHREKLDGPTIRALNRILGEELARFGYPT
jgi:hypothetical protein